jgi:hypothetical protein
MYWAAGCVYERRAVIGVVEDDLQVEERQQLNGGTVEDEEESRQIASRGFELQQQAPRQAPLGGRYVEGGRVRIRGIAEADKTSALAGPRRAQGEE